MKAIIIKQENPSKLNRGAKVNILQFIDIGGIANAICSYHTGYLLTIPIEYLHLGNNLGGVKDSYIEVIP